MAEFFTKLRKVKLPCPHWVHMDRTDLKFILSFLMLMYKLRSCSDYFVGVFPEPDKDPVIQIANMVIRQGERDPFIRNVFTLRSCAPVVGSQVISNEKESDLLKVTLHDYHIDTV